MADFEKWLTGPMDETRVPVRKLIREAGYRSILDVGCGLCAEHDGFKAEKYDIDYVGLDLCAELVFHANARNVKVHGGSIENAAFPDKQFDVVHCRGVLEHLEDFRKAMGQMVRLASKEVMVSWFIPPGPTEKKSRSEKNGVVLWHNRFNRGDVEAWMMAQGLTWSWVPLPRKFELLRITVA